MDQARRLSLYLPLAGLVLLVLIAQPAFGQIGHALAPPAPAAAPPQPPPDPLGRSNPRTMTMEFIRAVHRNDFVSAARYMQLTQKQEENKDVLARDLKELLDRYFTEPLTSISDSPTGSLDDGLPLDQERIGPLNIGDQKFDVILVRVDRPQSGMVWLISSDTLAQVPAMHASIEQTWIQQLLPERYLNKKVWGVPVDELIAWALSLGLPLLLLWLVSAIYSFLLPKLVTHPSRFAAASLWNKMVRWPLVIVLTLIVHLASIYFLGFSLNFRTIYARCVMVALVVAITWMIRRLMRLIFESARHSMKRSGRTENASLVLLAGRLLNVLLVIIAVLCILTIAGVDTKTALAGLGIGGVAVAFGAQKTVENLLGGIFLLTDQALAVGDSCCISNRMGTVEDITLRSVRLRTPEQSLMSIPAGALSQASIENFTTRGKIPVQTKLRLRYGLNPEQIQTILTGIRQLLKENQKIESSSSYVRLVDFGVNAIEFDLFAYLLTSRNDEFLSIREELLLQIATVVDSAGASFSTPTQFVYLDRPPGDDMDDRVGSAHLVKKSSQSA